MHIYCDESGGFDGDKHSLIIGAVQIGAADAGRLIKQFRKATGLRNEIKGGLLSASQRETFFSMLGGAEGVSTAISCRRASPLGGWASRSLSEHEVYSHMLIEACEMIVGNEALPFINIVADGGRYSKVKLEAVRETVVTALGKSGSKVSLEFASSVATQGVQVADIVSNTVYQATSASDALGAHSDILLPLIACNRLRISRATLSTVKPTWLAAE